MGYVNTNMFGQQLNGYGASMPETYQLATSAADYQMPMYQAAAPNLGNYGSQLSMGGGEAASAASGMAGGIAGAGAQAVAAAAGIISQAVQADASREANARESKLDRAQRQSLVTQQLSNTAEANSKTRQANSYKMLMEAMSNSYMNSDAGYRVKRGAAAGMDEILSSAMLGRR